MSSREVILDCLRSKKGVFVSGEELGGRLGISRVAIGNHIRKLREQGYDIESTVSQGHRLLAEPDLLLPQEICGRLTTQRFGREIHYLTSTASTSSIAKQKAAEGAPEGAIFITEEQTGGRGRLSRGWFSPAMQGIWFSLVLRPPFAPQEAPKCTLLAAVALCTAIRKESGIACGIKWPNDILCGGHKLVGILTEMNAEMDAINYVVIGIGINVNIARDAFPEELRDIATSVSMEAGRSVSRLDLLLCVLLELEFWYDKALHDGFAPILDEWRRLSVTIGQEVSVVAPDRSFIGVAENIDDDGALLVRTDTGQEKVWAGDVSIRPVRKT